MEPVLVSQQAAYQTDWAVLLLDWLCWREIEALLAVRPETAVEIWQRLHCEPFGQVRQKQKHWKELHDELQATYRPTMMRFDIATGIPLKPLSRIFEHLRQHCSEEMWQMRWLPGMPALDHRHSFLSPAQYPGGLQVRLCWHAGSWRFVDDPLPLEDVLEPFGTQGEEARVAAVILEEAETNDLGHVFSLRAWTDHGGAFYRRLLRRAMP